MNRLSGAFIRMLVAILTVYVRPTSAQNSGISMSSVPSAVVPKLKIVAKINPKAIWLLESAAARLRSAKTVRAVNLSYTYIGDRDTVPSRIEIDTVRYQHMQGEYRSRYTFTHYGVYWSIQSLSSEQCLKYSHNVRLEYEPWVSKIQLLEAVLRLRTKLLSTASKGEANRCEKSRDSVFSFPGPLQALNIRQIGQRMGLGEWGIERLDDPLLHSISYEGKRMWNGKLYDIVEFSYETAATMPENYMIYTTTMYLDSDQIVWRVITANNKGSYCIDDQIQSIDLNIPLREANFLWSSPTGIILKSPKLHNKRPSLVGQQIPNFTGTGQMLDGTIVTIADIIKRNKGTFLWFWNTTCSTCMEKFPHFEQIYREYRDQGIQIVVVNIMKPEQNLINTRIYQAYHQSTMPIVFVSGDWNEWVQNYPYTTVDGTGRIVYDGSNKAKLRSVFASLVLTKQ